MGGIKVIIWDWNGTLLDDAELCRNIINKLLTSRNIPSLSIEKYKQIFTFPVKDYYREAGFDFNKEAFEIPADEFMISYHKKIKTASLHQGTNVILNIAKEKYKQFIVSAMEQDSLVNLVHEHNIHHYFEDISGINNHYAKGKKSIAKNLISKYKLNPEEICLIGDTIHDHEVAEEIGCECMLIADGHQSMSRLATTGRMVLNNLTELKSYL
jgi:phosphoglycolate phosphatase